MTTARSKLLTHLYEYFAVLLGCSMYGTTDTPYAGDTSMYQVHKYMGLSEAEFTYFVTQVGLSAASFGVTTDDVTAVGDALMKSFGYRCAPPAAIPPTATPALQAICIEVSQIPKRDTKDKADFILTERLPYRTNGHMRRLRLRHGANECQPFDVDDDERHW